MAISKKGIIEPRPFKEVKNISIYPNDVSKSKPELKKELSDVVNSVDGVVSPSLKSQSEALLNIDYLQITAKRTQYTQMILDSLEKKEFDVKEKHQVIRSYGTKTYESRYVYFFDGLKTADILINARGAVDENTVNVKYENWVHYHQNNKDIVLMVLEIFKLRFNTISRIDVALDVQSKSFYKISSGFKSIPGLVKNMITGKITVHKKLKVDYYMENGVISGLGIGRRPKRLVIYNKTEQLKTVEKPYINELHEWAFSKDDGDIWRFEAQISNLGRKSIQVTSDGEILGNITLENIYDVETKKCLLWYVLEKNFDIRKNDNVRTTRKTRLLKLKVHDFYVKQVSKDMRKAKKLVVNGLLKEAITCEDENIKTCLVGDAVRIAKKYNLQLYFFDKIEKYDLEEFNYLYELIT